MHPQTNKIVCPHCRKEYPLKPVLLNRTMRCTSCRQPFHVDSQGESKTVETQSHAAHAITPRTGALVRKASAPSDSQSTGALTRKKTSSSSDKRPASYERKPTARHETMAKELRSSFANATAAFTKQTPKRAKSSARLDTQGYSSQKDPLKSLEVTLTNSGDSGQRNRKAYALSIAVFVLLVLGVFWLVNRVDPRNAALLQVIQRDGDETWTNPHRHRNVRNRVLVYPAQGYVLGQIDSLVPSNPKPLFQIGDQQILSEFLRTHARDAVTKSWKVAGTDEIAFRDGDLADELNEIGLSETLVSFCVDFFTQDEAITSRGEQIRKLLLSNDLPDEAFTATISGRGSLLVPKSSGLAYEFSPTRYQAQIVRFGTGDSSESPWPTEWLVWKINVSGL